MTNKYVKKRLVSREIQLKTTTLNHYIHTRRAEITGTDNKYRQGCGTEGTLIPTNQPDELLRPAATLENSLAVSPKPKYKLATAHSNYAPRYFLEMNDNVSTKMNCMKMPIMLLIIEPNSGNYPMYTYRRMDKQSSTAKQYKKQKSNTHTTMWISIKNVMLTKTIQTLEHPLCNLYEIVYHTKLSIITETR